MLSRKTRNEIYRVQFNLAFEDRMYISLLVLENSGRCLTSLCRTFTVCIVLVADVLFFDINNVAIEGFFFDLTKTFDLYKRVIKIYS